MKKYAFLAVFLFFIVCTPLHGVAGDVSVSIGVVLTPLTFIVLPDVVVVPSGKSMIGVSTKQGSTKSGAVVKAVGRQANITERETMGISGERCTRVAR